MILCLQNIYVLSQVFREGPSRHLSSKINTALLSYGQKGEQCTEGETFRKAKLGFVLSLPSELLSRSYSILKHGPEIKACPWEFSCILNHTRTEKYISH